MSLSVPGNTLGMSPQLKVEGSKMQSNVSTSSIFIHFCFYGLCLDHSLLIGAILLFTRPCSSTVY